MPAVDQCHDQVVRALEKSGWRLYRSPANFFTPERTVFIDMELSRRQNGTSEQIILVEVKCFPESGSMTKELYSSIGQYLVYRAILQELELVYDLYLSVPQHIFVSLFDSAVNRVINDNQLKLVIIDLESEEVVKWIEF